MKQTVSEALAARVCALANVPEQVQDICRDLLVDVAGLCIAARHSDYIAALKKSFDSGGPCTALGHAENYRPEDAAMLNGTAAHGEDFDDTFEGGPVHSGAVVVPAVLAAANASAWTGTGPCSASPPRETMCR